MTLPRREEYRALRDCNEKALRQRRTFSNPPINDWDESTGVQVGRRLSALMAYVGVQPSLHGWRHLSLWLLANPVAVTGLRQPKSRRPPTRLEPLPPCMADHADLPTVEVKDRMLSLIRSYRHYIQEGLSKGDASARTADEYNLDARMQASTDSTFSPPPKATAAAIMKWDERNPGELPLYGLAEERHVKSGEWMNFLEAQAPAEDFFVLSVEIKLKALASGRCTAEEFRETMDQLTVQHLEAHALGVDTRHFRTKTRVNVAAV